MLAVKCLDDLKGPKDRWFYPRGQDKAKTCRQLPHDIYSEEVQKMGLSAGNIVFTVQFPLPRDGQELSMSRWFQGLLGVLHPEIIYQGGQTGRCIFWILPSDWAISLTFTEVEMEIEIHARIGYRNRDDPEDAWKEIDRSVESRQLECNIEEVCLDEVHRTNPIKTIKVRIFLE